MNFGARNWLAQTDWVSDVQTAAQWVQDLQAFVVEWIDVQHTTEDVIDADFQKLAKGACPHQLYFQCFFKRLLYLMNAKLLNGVRDFVRVESRQATSDVL